MTTAERRMTDTQHWLSARIQRVVTLLVWLPLYLLLGPRGYVLARIPSDLIRVTYRHARLAARRGFRRWFGRRYEGESEEVHPHTRRFGVPVSGINRPAGPDAFQRHMRLPVAPGVMPIGGGSPMTPTDVPAVGAPGPGYWEDAMDILKRARERVGDVMDFGATGDGVDDDSSSFTDALADFDVVLAPPNKQFLISDVAVGNDKTLTGGGAIKKASAAESALHLTGTNVRITGLVFDAESTSGQPNGDIKLGDGGKNIQIDHNVFKSPTYSAIIGAENGGTPYTDPTDGIQIQDNRFVSGSGRYTRPIYLHSFENLLIQGNVIRDCNFDGIRLREDGGYTIIDGNWFINIGEDPPPDNQTRDAIDTLYSGEKLVISNNIVRRTSSLGFDVKGNNGDGSIRSERITITGNQIYEARFSGIGVSSAAFDLRGITISENTVQACNQRNSAGGGSISDAAIKIEGNVDNGAICKDVKIIDNQVFENFGHGIYLTIGLHKYITIRGNTCINNTERGIFTNHGEYMHIVENTCRDDPDYENSGAQLTGINHQGDEGAAASVVIRDNICTGHSGADINLGPAGDKLTTIAEYRGNIVDSASPSTLTFQRRFFVADSTPVAGDGTFRRGDVFLFEQASAGGKIGQVCITGGTPGTWKSFGPIDA